jgi:hypothetical protein
VLFWTSCQSTGDSCILSYTNPPTTRCNMSLKIMMCRLPLVCQPSCLLDKMRVSCTFQQWLIPLLLPSTMSQNHELKHNQGSSEQKKKKTSENKGIRELKYQDLNPLTWGCNEHGLPPISRNQPRKLKEWRNCLLTNEDSNESRYNLCFSSVHAADGPWPCFKNKIKKEKEY